MILMMISWHFLFVIICVPSTLLFICLLLFDYELGASLVHLVTLGFCTQSLLRSSELRVGCPPETPLKGDLARLFH